MHRLPIKVTYEGREIPGPRLDLRVEGGPIVECKAVEAITKVHKRQALSSLKTTKLRLAFIFNFNVDVLMPTGFERIVL